MFGGLFGPKPSGSAPSSEGSPNLSSKQDDPTKGRASSVFKGALSSLSSMSDVGSSLLEKAKNVLSGEPEDVFGFLGRLESATTTAELNQLMVWYGKRLREEGARNEKVFYYAASQWIHDWTEAYKKVEPKKIVQFFSPSEGLESGIPMEVKQAFDDCYKAGVSEANYNKQVPLKDASQATIQKLQEGLRQDFARDVKGVHVFVNRSGQKEELGVTKIDPSWNGLKDGVSRGLAVVSQLEDYQEGLASSIKKGLEKTFSGVDLEMYPLVTRLLASSTPQDLLKDSAFREKLLGEVRSKLGQDITQMESLAEDRPSYQTAIFNLKNELSPGEDLTKTLSDKETEQRAYLSEFGFIPNLTSIRGSPSTVTAEPGNPIEHHEELAYEVLQSLEGSTKEEKVQVLQAIRLTSPSVVIQILSREGVKVELSKSSNTEIEIITEEGSLLVKQTYNLDVVSVEDGSRKEFAVSMEFDIKNKTCIYSLSQIMA